MLDDLFNNDFAVASSNLVGLDNSVESTDLITPKSAINTLPAVGFTQEVLNLDAQALRVDDSALAVAQNQDGRLDVFTIGTDGQIWHQWQTQHNNHQNWSNRQA